VLAHSTGNELTRGPPELVQQFRLQGGIHIGARALHVLNLIWFGYITRLSQWGGGGNSIILLVRSAPNVVLAHSPYKLMHTLFNKINEKILNSKSLY
jgi:hypothetical protein